MVRNPVDIILCRHDDKSCSVAQVVGNNFSMNFFKLIITAGAITLFTTGVCDAQLGGTAPLPQIQKPAGPSLEETTQWITQKFESLPPVGSGFTYKTVVFFDSCNVAAVEQGTSGQGTFSGQISLFPLDRLDIERVSSRPGTGDLTFATVSIGTLGKEEVVLVRTLGSQPNLLSNKKLIKDTIEKNKIPDWHFDLVRDSVSIKLPDLEIAERIGSAFKHAISLCQQKAAQEKAAQPAKPKELF